MNRVCKCGFSGSCDLFVRGRNMCKVCEKRRKKDHYEQNKERIGNRRYQYRQRTKEQKSKYDAQYYQSKKDKIKGRVQIYQSTRKARKSEYDVMYRKNNATRYRENRQKRLNSDPLFRLRKNLSSRIRDVITSKGYTKKSYTKELLGAEYSVVWAHLINTAKNNYGKYFPKRKYHIDHIIPCSSAKTEEELVKLQHYTNLQLLTPLDNLKKGAKLDWSI